MSRNGPTWIHEDVELKLHAVLQRTMKVNSFNFRMIRRAVKGTYIMQSVHVGNRLDEIVRRSERGEQIKIPAPFAIISPRYSHLLNGCLGIFSASSRSDSS